MGKINLISLGALFILLSVGKPGPEDPAEGDAPCLKRADLKMGHVRAERRLFQIEPPDELANPCLGIFPVKSLTLGQALEPPRNRSCCIEQFPVSESLSSLSACAEPCGLSPYKGVARA